MCWIQQAKLIGLNCVAQQSMDTEPLGSNTVNVAAAEFRVKCQNTLYEKG